jgi:DNA polymerase-3 subunit beta
MELTIERDNLLRGIAKAQNIVEKRTTMPILSNILLEAQDSTLAVTATDLEIGFKGNYAAQVATPGAVTISGKKLYEIVRGLNSSEVRIREMEGGRVQIKGGGATYSLVSLPAEDFPPLPQHDSAATVKAPASQLAEMIEKVIIAVAAEEMRFNLSGVFAERVTADGTQMLRLVSTDGHRLSLAEREFPGVAGLELEKGVILPRKGLVELSRLLDEEGEVEFGFHDNSAVFRKDEMVLVMRLIEGSFPDYRLVLPKESTRKLTAPRGLLAESFRRMSILLSERSRGVKLDLAPGRLKVSVNNPELGQAEEEIDVEFGGSPLSIGFNARYLIDALGVMRSETVELGFNEEANPCRIGGPEDAGSFCIVMPMRI